MSRTEFLALPYLLTGPLSRQWAVRARTFDVFMKRFVGAQVAKAGELRVLDVGAGNCWLSRRVALAGASVTAVDFRDDSVDGLAASNVAVPEEAHLYHRVAASFDALPMRSQQFDIVVFNASLHYAVDLHAVLEEARRMLRRDGRIVILDSPFYQRAADGELMVAEKRRHAAATFGAHASVLMSYPMIEYLTADRLVEASRGLGLIWRRHPVRYPLWYEIRGFMAWLQGRRTPSRFDLWEGVARRS